jgi:hypothetical protein
MNGLRAVTASSSGMRTVGRMRTQIALLVMVAAVAGCGSNGVAATKSKENRFVSRVDNPWFPLAPGTTFVYRGVKDGKRSRDVVRVTRRAETIDGVHCTVVKDLLYLTGKLEERTTDWYAQDAAGNVWYYGERTAELDARGRVKSTAGTWRAGVHGAVAGIYMPAHPRVGQTGRQEYFKGQAEDHYRVRSLSTRVRTPAASSSHALLTEEWTPLEPGVLDHKYYVRGIGTVLEQTVKGGDERNTLESVHRRR